MNLSYSYRFYIVTWIACEGSSGFYFGKQSYFRYISITKIKFKMLSADKHKQDLMRDQLNNLSVGTKFRQNFKKSGEPHLFFEITQINDSGKLIVKVTNPQTDSVWEEDWSGDLEILKNAINIGEYALL